MITMPTSKVFSLYPVVKGQCAAVIAGIIIQKLLTLAQISVLEMGRSADTTWSHSAAKISGFPALVKFPNIPKQVRTGTAVNL